MVTVMSRGWPAAALTCAGTHHVYVQRAHTYRCTRTLLLLLLLVDLLLLVLMLLLLLHVLLLLHTGHRLLLYRRCGYNACRVRTQPCAPHPSPASWHYCVASYTAVAAVVVVAAEAWGDLCTRALHTRARRVHTPFFIICNRLRIRCL